MSSRNNSQFNSTGFDLSAASDQEGDVVYEIGGGATVVAPPATATREVIAEDGEDDDDVMRDAESYKLKGNNAFKEQNWELALEQYTKAIEATPGISAIELLKQRDEFLEDQGKQMRKRYLEEEEERRKRKEDGDKEPSKPKEPEPFVPPFHPHADKVSVYHCNRAAVYLHLQEYDQVISDCDAAILWNPKYTKALMRRCQAYEAKDETDKALNDAKTALELDPSNLQFKQTVKRLEKIEAERLEKLKSETMEKLKDLGNSILGNFGLSLDNFKAVQDPNTGSYSLSFGNNNEQS